MPTLRKAIYLFFHLQLFSFQLYDLQVIGAWTSFLGPDLLLECLVLGFELIKMG